MNNRTIIATFLVVASLLASPLVIADIAQESDANAETAGKISVYVDGVKQEQEYETMKAALEYVNNTGNVSLEKKVTLVCEANKPIAFGGNHITIQRSITIEGNDAYAVKSVSEMSAEVTFDIEAYGSLHDDTTVTINSFHNATVWGQRAPTDPDPGVEYGTDYDFTLVMNDCDSGDPNKVSGFRVYISGTTGNNYITLNDCDFGTNSSNCTVYSNANGSLELNNCTFDTINEPININSKSSTVDMRININGCSFKDCGQGTGNDEKWAAPIRVVNSGSNSGNSYVSVDSCSFSYSPDVSSVNGDILIGDGRHGETSQSVSLTTVNTEASVQFQSPGYYATDGSRNPSNMKEVEVKESQVLESNGGSITIVDAEPDPTPTPGGDEDDDFVPPFIPADNGGTDTTYLIAACAAAAVVALLSALLVMMERRK